MNISFASETRLLNNFPSVCFPLWNSIACTPAGGCAGMNNIRPKTNSNESRHWPKKQWESNYHKFWSSKRLGMRKMTLCIANRNNDNGIFYRIMRELLAQLKGVFFANECSITFFWIFWLAGFLCNLRYNLEIRVMRWCTPWVNRKM